VVRWGNGAPGDHPFSMDVGNVTNCTIQVPCRPPTHVTYEAYNTAGLEGPPSDEYALPPTCLESWRKYYFGRTDNGGDAADTACPAGDGVPNILKFACHLNPLVSIEQSKRPRLGR
jgi:hypothetical protein